MLLLVILTQALFFDLRVYNVTDWAPWAVTLPLTAGIPLWILWTWMKIRAAKKVRAQDNVLEDW